MVGGTWSTALLRLRENIFLELRCNTGFMFFLAQNCLGASPGLFRLGNLEHDKSIDERFYQSDVTDAVTKISESFDLLGK